MNLKNKKILIVLMFSIMLILVLISMIVDNNKSKTNFSNVTNEESKNYVYGFGETLNLETEEGMEENESIGTDISGIGIIPDYYDDNDVIFGNNQITFESFEGIKIVAFSWPEEGVSSLIEEPSFGILDRVISNKEYTEITAIYKEVTIKNIDSYINLLSGMGFSNVERKEKNKGKDYYDYIATNADGLALIINYSEGIMNLKLR